MDFEYWELPDYYSDYEQEMNDYYDSLPPRYTVYYIGAFFSYDIPCCVAKDGTDYHSKSFESNKEAFNLYNSLIAAGYEAWVEDNMYDVTFKNGEWN